MAKYQITAPDGNSYEINAPDTANETEVMAYAKANYQKQETTPHPISKRYPSGEEYSPVGRAAEYLGSKTYSVGKEALDQAGGILETGLALGSGLTQLPVKAFAGLGGLARGFSTGREDEAVKTIKGIEEFGQKFQYEPKYTESGKRVASGMGELFSIPSKVGRVVGDVSQDVLTPYIGQGNAAAIGASIATVGEAAPYFIGGKKAGGAKAAEKMVTKLIPSSAPLEYQISRTVKQGVLKGIRPSPKVVGDSIKAREQYFSKAQHAIEDIITNKTTLETMDNAGGVVKGALPRTVGETANAIQIGKMRTISAADDMAKSATGKGVMVDVAPIVKGLEEITTGEFAESLARTSPQTLAYAQKMLEKYKEAQNAGGITATAAQRDIMTLNAGQRAASDYNTILKVGVDSDVLHNLRKLTDDAITKTEGPGYQQFKNTYGAYRTLEKEVNRMATKVGEKTDSMFGEYADVYTGFHAVKGLLMHSPETLAAAGAAKLIKEAQRRLRHPDNITRKMFENTEKLMAKRPVAKVPVIPVSSPVVPPPSPPPSPFAANERGLPKSPLTRVGTTVGGMSDDAMARTVNQTRRENAVAAFKNVPPNKVGIESAETLRHAPDIDLTKKYMPPTIPGRGAKESAEVFARQPASKSALESAEVFKENFPWTAFDDSLPIRAASIKGDKGISAREMVDALITSNKKSAAEAAKILNSIPVYGKTVINLTPSREASITAMREEISQGAAGRWLPVKDAEGYTAKWIAEPSTFPSYFQNKGLLKDDTLAAIDRVLKGEPVTKRQWGLVSQLDSEYRKGLVPRALKLRAESKDGFPWEKPGWDEEAGSLTTLPTKKAETVIPKADRRGIDRESLTAGRQAEVELARKEGNQPLLHKLLYEDPDIPGLLNKRAWVKDEPALMANKDVNIYFADGIGVKWVNDKMGYEAGDKLLSSIANLAKKHDLDIYRVGGDEFVIVGGKGVAGRLKDMNIELAKQEIGGHKGFTIRYAQGENKKAAAERVNIVKEKSIQKNKDVERGDTPLGVTKVVEPNDLTITATQFLENGQKVKNTKANAKESLKDVDDSIVKTKSILNKLKD